MREVVMRDDDDVFYCSLVHVRALGVCLRLCVCGYSCVRARVGCGCGCGGCGGCGCSYGCGCVG